MKALVRKLSFGILAGAALAVTGTMNAQIDYFQDFSINDGVWSDRDFTATSIAVCDGGNALRANPMNDLGTPIPVETVSQSLGISNGEEVILSYNYKLLYYDDMLPYKALADADWGMLTIEYGPTQNGPWRELDMILPENHRATDECLTRKIAFTPPNGEAVFLRIIASGATEPGISYFVYVDNISLLQENITIAPIVADTDFKTWPNPVTDYLHLDYNGAINEVTIYDMQGQVVVVEDIDRNLRRLDMSGLTEGNYVMKVYADNELRTINIVKD